MAAQENEQGKTHSRRLFLKLGMGGLVLSALASLAALARFYKPKVLFEPPTKFVAGKPNDFPRGEIVTRFLDKQKVIIIHGDNGIYAFLAICTHLGCALNFESQARIFKCPCHGSNFNIDGKVIAGPAPKPLNRTALFLDTLGRIVVDKADLTTKPEGPNKNRFVLNVTA